MGIGKERRRLGLGREVLMMSWGSVRAGCLLALSGGRRGRLQARISSRFCPSACACVPPLFYYHAKMTKGHSSTSCGRPERERGWGAGLWY
jgi:hypothetical protein